MEKKKFCRFCAEPHKRRESTCSDGCSSELVRTEFQENGDLERSCLWCPVRGDLATFKHANTCLNCYSHRLSLGACRVCGGPNDLPDCCFRCSTTIDIFDRDKDLRAFVLLDRTTRRARKFFTTSPAVKIPRSCAGVIEVSRENFERPLVTEWEGPTALIAVSALEGPAISTRIAKLKLYLKTGQQFTAAQWVKLYVDATGADPGSSMRHFERSKVSLRSWGVKVTAVRDSRWTHYEFDEDSAFALLTYYKTVLKNKQMGYYW